MPTTDESSDSAPEALAAWIRDQPIARRTRAALLRDLDRASAQRDDGAAESQLAGLSPASFVVQLHTSDGGPISRVPGISARALAGLRRALPLPAPSHPEVRAGAGAPPSPPGPTLDVPVAPVAPPDDTGAAIAAAASGLLVPSESDSPFTLFWQDGGSPPTPAALLAQLALPPSTPVRTCTLEEFFGPLTAVADWMDDAQRAQAARFAELRNQITARLRDIVVYRFGQVRVTLLIVGRGPAGDIVGLTATLVET